MLITSVLAGPSNSTTDNFGNETVNLMLTVNCTTITNAHLRQTMKLPGIGEGTFTNVSVLDGF